MDARGSGVETMSYWDEFREEEELRQMGACISCRGSGKRYVDADHEVPCEECYGTGCEDPTEEQLEAIWGHEPQDHERRFPPGV